ncbi:SDR family oxidoreductase [Nonomuraea longicatena]|uniref:NAD(P)H-binding protein n=1 Tax=Nonomuraea longicatena TaxID=83682 RepID=A0ABP4A3Z0_9ACTN
MILVIGATGNVGGQVVTELLDLGVSVRALTRDPARAALPGAAEVVRGDFSVPESLREALHGVEAVFLLWPLPTTEVAPKIMKLIAEHARRVVFLSSGAVRDDIAEQTDMIGRWHAEVEQAIKDSGVEWTMLRPHGFATNIRRWLPQLQAGDVVRGAYGEAAMTLLHERDIAAVAARALTRDGLSGRDLVLTGPEPLTQVEQVRTIGEVVGRPLRWEEIPVETARQEMLAWQPAELVDLVLDGYAQMVSFPGPGTTTVEEVTGRPARTFREWVADHAADFR